VFNVDEIEARIAYVSISKRSLTAEEGPRGEGVDEFH